MGVLIYYNKFANTTLTLGIKQVQLCERCVSVLKNILKLKEFLEEGGKMIMIKMI